MLKTSPKNSEIFFGKENKESNGKFDDISFVEMESSKWINYLTNMGQSDKGTTIVYDLTFKWN